MERIHGNLSKYDLAYHYALSLLLMLPVESTSSQVAWFLIAHPQVCLILAYSATSSIKPFESTGSPLRLRSLSSRTWVWNSGQRHWLSSHLRKMYLSMWRQILVKCLTGNIFRAWRGKDTSWDIQVQVIWTQCFKKKIISLWIWNQWATHELILEKMKY